MTPFDLLQPVVGDFLPLVAVVGFGLILVALAARVVPALRQTAYEGATAGEMVRLQLAVPAGYEPEPDVGVELIRALHPRHRRGLDAFRVGWPSLDLRVVWSDGELRWQVDCPRQVEPAVTVALRSACALIGIERLERDDPPAVAAASASLAASERWPLRTIELPEARALVRLARALSGAQSAAEVRLRITLRPIPPGAWRRLIDPDDVSPSIGSLVGSAIADGLLFRPTSATEPVRWTPTLAEREAAKRKRSGVVGFATGAVLEIAGVDGEAAHALLWRFASFTDLCGDAHQTIDWTIDRGHASPTASMKLADWEVAELWGLPTAALDTVGVPRQRPLVAPAPSVSDGRALVIGRAGQEPVALALDVLGRHVAVFGATGSGKSTLLLALATELLRTGVGGTIVDPHGDLADDILARVPDSAIEGVHVLRLADRLHPRAFNFLERGTPDEGQLVTSEFVDMLEDLWPRFCGPKMQDYLRHALLTLLSVPEPQTVLELIRLLTDDESRRKYTEKLSDPLLAHFWRTQWPGPRERERDTSIKAVLNKLGAFVAYESIRQVVGQGVSTIRPRTLMDRGDVLVVDLSRVGGDNASLFGAMLISRYYIDAVGRQGTPRSSRRPHLLVVDEAQRFDTRALGRISVEGRKFGLALALASQSLAGLGDRLRSTILTNAASLILLSPGADDVRSIGRLFDPVPPERLSDLRRFEFVLRTPGPDGSASVYGGRVEEPRRADPERAELVAAASDQRDARELATVRGEVHDRASGTWKQAEAEAETAAPKSHGR